MAWNRKVLTVPCRIGQVLPGGQGPGKLHDAGAKGGEEDNVVLLTDLTHNTKKSYDKNQDDETRLFYVGATRTKEHLHIIRPKDENKCYPMQEVL